MTAPFNRAGKIAVLGSSAVPQNDSARRRRLSWQDLLATEHTDGLHWVAAGSLQFQVLYRGVYLEDLRVNLFFYLWVTKPSPLHPFWRKELWKDGVLCLELQQKYYPAPYNLDKWMRHHPVEVLHMCDVLKAHELLGVQVMQKNIFVLEIPTIPPEVMTLSLQLTAVPNNLAVSGYWAVCWRSQTGGCAINPNFWAEARK